MQIKCIIVEDEPLAQERTKSYVQKLPFLQLAGVFENGVDALVFMRSNPIDLIFLDINLGELSGIGLLEAANFSGEIIITTAYDNYALKGFELNVTDYLLKPFTFERFLQAVGRAQENLALKINSAADRKFVFIKTENRLEKVLIDELLYIEGMRDYRRIHTVSRRIMTLRTFRELEEELPAGRICRVHKSFMVALDKIDSIERDRIRINDVLIPISEMYRKDFFARINHSK
jgi:two-component system, LytTR family, response regulator